MKKFLTIQGATCASLAFAYILSTPSMAAAEFEVDPQSAQRTADYYLDAQAAQEFGIVNSLQAAVVDVESSQRIFMHAEIREAFQDDALAIRFFKGQLEERTKGIWLREQTARGATKINLNVELLEEAEITSRDMVMYHLDTDDGVIYTFFKDFGLVDAPQLPEASVIKRRLNQGGEEKRLTIIETDELVKVTITDANGNVTSQKFTLSEDSMVVETEKVGITTHKLISKRALLNDALRDEQRAKLQK